MRNRYILHNNIEINGSIEVLSREWNDSYSTKTSEGSPHFSFIWKIEKRKCHRHLSDIWFGSEQLLCFLFHSFRSIFRRQFSTLRNRSRTM